jgi:adenine phosphoribosyltransferase
LSFEDKINFQAPGGRCDVTPVFADALAFSDLIERMLGALKGHDFELIAGIDALGFILGAALAQRMGCGFLAIRKGGKLPVVCEELEFTDYTGKVKSLALAKGAFREDTKIVIVDDWIETGAQVRAAIALIERQKGSVVGIAAIKIDKPGKELGFGDRFCCGLLTYSFKYPLISMLLKFPSNKCRLPLTHPYTLMVYTIHT